MRILFIAGLFLSAAVARAEVETVDQFLRRFHANPAAEMERLPMRWDEKGKVAAPAFIDHDEVARSLEFRNSTRDSIVGQDFWPTLGIGMGSPDGKDRAENLVEGGVVVSNLAEIEARGLTKSTLSTIPWPDSYWPFFRGIISNRYAEPGYPKSKDWATNYQYIRMRPASIVIASGDATAINNLSPAEKYDYVMGDWNFTLTNHGWLKGEEQVQKYGSVAKWMGICHGWSAAAHMLAPLPAQAVSVIGASGRAVTFYPQDIKALQSMLWANASPDTRFLGNRCNLPKPPRNEYGRIMDPKCFDSNPGTWHMAITNQVGIHQRSFVMDATFDLEVWNFAVASYSYRYYNPETFKEGGNLRASMVPIGEFRVDKFREFRSPEARYVVGVAMDVAFVNAIAPTRNPNVKTPFKNIRFIYDLELDANLNIVGGEWYSNAHPDFLWTFNRDAQAMTRTDGEIINENWSAGGPVPTTWADKARRASNRGAPLYSFVRGVLTGAIPVAEPPPLEEEEAPAPEL